MWPISAGCARDVVEAGTIASWPLADRAEVAITAGYHLGKRQTVKPFQLPSAWAMLASVRCGAHSSMKR